jgi:hypothetical protein
VHRLVKNLTGFHCSDLESVRNPLSDTVLVRVEGNESWIHDNMMLGKNSISLALENVLKGWALK